MITRKILITVLATLTAAASAGAQTPPTEKPAGVSDRDLIGLTMTPAELDVFIKKARERRLSMERDQVATEIRSGML
ncbi:MAG: hypothetical protein KAV00_13065, partial [Phycisphaerae bacterium]|nr:hypothetical protein [Phycisphaerae bacterium]